MNVNRNNLFAVLEDFENEIARCTFCAIDQEMTGIDAAGEPTVLGSPPEEIYRVKRLAAEQYIAFQFGITLFTLSSEDNRYEVRPYNFLLIKSDGDVKLSMSAIAFLASHKMNFQDWLTTGMNYCSAEEEEALLQKNMIHKDDVDGKVLDTLLEKLHGWKDDGIETELSIPINCTYKAGTLVARYLSSQVVCNNMSVTYSGDPAFGEPFTFIFTKLTPSQWDTVNAKRKENEKMKLGSALGFRQFWKVLVNAKKPIVGHNFMSDIMFMMKMHEQSLPDCYDEFKAQVRVCFPAVYDTKSIAQQVPDDAAFCNTSLGELFNECRRRSNLESWNMHKFIRFPSGFYDYDERSATSYSNAHNAAYDAFMTGTVYILLKRLYNCEETLILNKISSFGSTFYMRLDQQDSLVSPYTFIIHVKRRCHVSELKALFYNMDAKSAKADCKQKKQFSFRLTSMNYSEKDGCADKFCILFYTPETVETVTRKLEDLRTNGNIKDNVDLSLLNGLTLSTL